MQNYDVIVIGAGPGGLTAAIYLARANRKVLLIHRGNGRTHLAHHIQNYLGFEEISGADLIKKGLKQLENYDVQINIENATNLEFKDNFILTTNKNTYSSKYVIAATGILDKIPDYIDNFSEFWSESFFTCLDCDGYRMNDKISLIIGDDVKTPLAVKKLFTKNIYYYSENIDEHGKKVLQENEIKLISRPVHLNGNNGILHSVQLQDNSEIKCECVLIDIGYKLNDNYLNNLDLKRDERRFIMVNEKCESSIPGLYVVGPLNQYQDQVSVSCGQGAVAAMEVALSKNW